MSKLHEFDLYVCDLLHTLLHHNLRDKRFAKILARTPPELLKYLRSDPSSDDYETNFRKLLLSDTDLADLHERLSSHARFCRGSPPRSTADRLAYETEIGMWYWPASQAIYRRAVRCLGEINSGLTRRQAELFDKRCHKYQLRLKKKSLRLDRGLKVIWEWLDDVRDLLRALGRTDLVPIPQGQYPTPLCPAEVSKNAASTLRDDNLLKNMNKFRKYFKAHPEKCTLKPDALRKELHIGNQPARKALRELQRLGEYNDFERPPPDRDPS